MTIIYSQNFDATTVGTLPAGWIVPDGSTWAVENTVFISSPNALGCSSGDGGKIVYSGQAALADMEIRYDVNPNSNSGFLGGFVRMSSDGANGYLVLPSSGTAPTGQWQFYKRVAGSFTSLGNTGNNPSLTGNVSVRLRVQGSTISVNMWPCGTTEPGGWVHQWTDTSITAAGYPGFYMQTTGAAVDNFTLDNLQTASISVSPSSVVVSSAGNSLTVTGVNTAWTSGTPGSPVFTVSRGTITAQTITSATSVTLTYTAPGSTGTVTITDPSTGATTTLTIAAATASDFTLTPSSLGTTPSVATGNYTVTLNGSLSTNETIALSDGGASGTFTPSSLTFTPGNAATPQTFTYTPASSTGGTTKTLTATATGQFSTNHSASCVVSAGPQIVAVTDSHILWPTAAWDHLTAGTFGVAVDTMQTGAPGPGPKFAVTNTATLKINVDTSTLTGFGTPPILRYSLDGANFVDVSLTNQSTVTVSTSLSTGSVYTLEAWLLSISTGDGNLWGSSGVSPTDVIRITGLTIDAAGVMQAFPTVRPKRMALYGDSITAGAHAKIDGTGNDDSTVAFGNALAFAMNAEYSAIGYSGQGFEEPGGTMPKFMTTYGSYSFGRARNFSGLDYLFIVQGTNDGRASVAGSTIRTDLATLLPALRTACGTATQIFVCSPPYGGYGSDMTTAVATYKTNSGDAKVWHIDPTAYFPANAFTITFGGTTENTYDGVHPNAHGHACLGAALGSAALAASTNSAGAGVGSRARIANA